MQKRRVRAGQIVWRQQSVTGVANSAIAVRVFVGRHKPIYWRQRPLAGTSNGSISESATLTDAVSAIFEGSVTTAESVTLSDTDTYPTTTFGQTMYRGRNPPIVWRQTETAFTGNSLTGAFADALSLVADTAASQSFAAVSTLESLTPTDTNDPVGGSSTVSIVEAETVTDSLGTVWDFTITQAENLNPVDAMTGIGGSDPVSPNRPSGGHHKPHKPPKPREQRIKEAQEAGKEPPKKKDKTEEEEEIEMILKLLKDFL